ncbi:hypothetical protein Q8F55_000573 [Vanrija albida]|uniref:F-box domain-containing protein n=1 Tax=Vanrija albida TaxID=181172 RepID=A0ABR3QDN2_9TREE
MTTTVTPHSLQDARLAFRRFKLDPGGQVLPPIAPPKAETKPKPSPRMEGASGGSLPAELLVMVLEHLDVNTDRSTYLSLLCVSPIFWEETARVLYRNIDMGADQVRRIFRGQISDRTRLALSFIKLLNLVDVQYAALQAMFAQAIPHQPLFPNVYKVHVVSTQRIHESKCSPGYFPPRDIFLFGSTHMCLSNAQHLGILRGLAAQETLSLSCHGDSRADVEYTLAHMLAQWSMKWHKDAMVYWFVDHLHTFKDIGPLEVSFPANIRIRCRTQTCHGDLPILFGPWDEDDSPRVVQFRRDCWQYEHDECLVCNQKDSYGWDRERQFNGEKFTKASARMHRNTPWATSMPVLYPWWQR